MDIAGNRPRAFLFVLTKVPYCHYYQFSVIPQDTRSFILGRNRVVGCALSPVRAASYLGILQNCRTSTRYELSIVCKFV